MAVEIRHADATTPATTPLDDHLERFTLHILADALLEGTCAYWRRRAAHFATVGTPPCDEIALACRRHADLLATTGLDNESQALLTAITGIPQDT